MLKLYTRSLIGAGKYIKGLYRMGVIEKERKAMMTTRDNDIKGLVTHPMKRSPKLFLLIVFLLISSVILVPKPNTPCFLLLVRKLKAKIVLIYFIVTYGANIAFLHFLELVIF